jgi:hypothetical protein
MEAFLKYNDGASKNNSVVGTLTGLGVFTANKFHKIFTGIKFCAGVQLYGYSPDCIRTLTLKMESVNPKVFYSIGHIF